MTKRLYVVGAVLVACLGLSNMALAAGKTYQVTGPVVELTDAKIVVEKGKEKWEVARTADTKVTGELRVGEKVTVEYTMTATTIEVKAAKAEAKAEKK
jgi:hypothetical protein